MPPPILMLYHFSEPPCLHLKTGARLTQFVLCKLRTAVVYRRRAGVGGRTLLGPNQYSKTRRIPCSPSARGSARSSSSTAVRPASRRSVSGKEGSRPGDLRRFGKHWTLRYGHTNDQLR